MANSFRDYVRATYKINIMQKSLSNDNKDSSIEAALDYIHNHLEEYKTEFKVILNNLIRDNELDKETDDETSLGEMLQFFDEADYFNKYVYIMEKSNLGTSQYKYLREFLDAVSMKNSASKLLADGRSRRHPRRGALPDPHRAGSARSQRQIRGQAARWRPVLYRIHHRRLGPRIQGRKRGLPGLCQIRISGA